MSIDAIINKITEDNGNLVLDLMSRELSGLRGQDTLTILDFTYKPTVGQEIWGGSGSCIIESGFEINEQKQYYRVGYTKLKEAF